MAITLPPTGSSQLAGVRAKLLRAQQHFDDLNSRIEAVLSSKANGNTIPLASEVDEYRKSVTFRLAKIQPLDPSLPLILGDCLHNLRSALDHLVLQIALLKGTPISDAQDKTIFPVVLDPKDFTSKTKRFAQLITPEALAAIEDVQPYKTSDPPTTAFLWLLSELDIIDKHRLLVVVSQKFRVTRVEAVISGPHRIVPDPLSDWKPREDGAELFAVELLSDEPTKVDVKVQTAAAVQFAETGLVCDGGMIQDVINGCGGFVEKIVDDFGHRFFGE